MTFKDFDKQIEEITGDDSADLYISPDFQCDQTGGFPTSLCVCWEKGKAWLVPNESMITNENEIWALEEQCAEFGIRSCYDTEDYNNLLRELGQDAVDMAWLPDDEEGMVLS